MKKWKGCGLAVTLMALINSAASQQPRLLHHRHFKNYSSASAMAWHKGRLYVMGDDAPTLLVLSKRLNEKRRFHLFDDTVQRISPAQKHDIESAFVWQSGNNTSLVLVPSFSTPARNKVITASLTGSRLHLQTIVDTPAGISVDEPNIEGSTVFEKGVLLAQRKLNALSSHALFHYRFSKKDGLQQLVRIINIKLPSAPAAGISGLCYAPKQDVLFFTFSSEATTDPTRDGAIGDSYLGWVEAWQAKAKHQVVAVQHLINLTPVLKSNKPQKIEAVAVQKERRKKMMLHLAADNDDGTSDVFTISVSRPR